ncbi:T9SS type A sorting domain-containing protein [Chryseobacterium wangxinyae]|uniref:T9SS type A sorting domain-containing protein n=1 Tax=Chryseobacterium sp. CY350 TaxID=2997336 RepID=UPI00226F412C|nr:T9SS type A sorting domain-containing protein [Chryseobacterium sp. CY350]MCY0978971.1 T9SS type A sorting domain-containing protein [Chryseobacterium sp. CY350]WBZ97301.1 T9SS type A sorting domain-containing protein [Chryseobacterium sp. CY350]
MKKVYLLSCIVLSALSFAQVSIPSSGTAVTQNFDNLETTLPAGWNAVRDSGTGTIGQVLAPVVDNGSANSGAVYSVGAASAADRALGTIASGSTVPAFGAQFSNNTGSAITSVSISFTEEQWRTGSNATVNEVVSFAYSTNASSFTDASATWTPLASGNLTEILTSAIDNAPVDGNLAANQMAKSFTISGLNIPNSGSLWIKWTDANDPGSDCMLAVDNFSITAQAGSLAVSDLTKAKSNFIKNTFVKNDEITFGADVKDLRIYNLNGQVVKTASVKAGYDVNIAELSKGNYIVTGTVNNKPVSQKILKD